MIRIGLWARYITTTIIKGLTLALPQSQFHQAPEIELPKPKRADTKSRQDSHEAAHGVSRGGCRKGLELDL